MGFVPAPRRVSSARRVAPRRPWPVPPGRGGGRLAGPRPGPSPSPPGYPGAPPGADRQRGPSAGYPTCTTSPGRGRRPAQGHRLRAGLRPRRPARRAGPVAGLAPTAFSATEDGRPVSLTVRPAAPDEPVALIVVADTNTGREWLPPPAPGTPTPCCTSGTSPRGCCGSSPRTGATPSTPWPGGPPGLPPLGDRATAEAARAAPPTGPGRPLAGAPGAGRGGPAGRPAGVAPADLRPQRRQLGLRAQLRAGAGVGGAGPGGRLRRGHPGLQQPLPLPGAHGPGDRGPGLDLREGGAPAQRRSPVLLDILVDQAVKSIKSAYRLEYTRPAPASNGSWA